MVHDLRAHSADSARLWLSPPDPADGPDRLHVPDGAGGRTRFDKDVLTLSPGDLRVVLFTEP